MADKEKLKQRLEELREEYSKTKYNKATNKHLGILRAKISKFRKLIIESKGKKGIGFSVKKSGDATVMLVGFPNAGKSSLLRALTGVDSKVAAYAFTTLEVIPGMMEYNGARIQVMDLPGLIEGAHIGKGGGTRVASVIRVADLLLFVVDINFPNQVYTLIDELSSLGIKVNRRKPNVLVEEKRSGGIKIESNGHKIPDKDDISTVLHEMGRYAASIIFYENIGIDDLVDMLLGSAVYVKGIIALNKIDTTTNESTVRRELEQKTGMTVIGISAMQNYNIGELKSAISSNLDIARIYLRPKGGNVDFEKPLIIRNGQSVMDVARILHSKIAKNLRYAYVSGRSAKFDNQRVGVDHVVKDGDIVTLVYEKA